MNNFIEVTKVTDQREYHIVIRSDYIGYFEPTIDGGTKIVMHGSGEDIIIKEDYSRIKSAICGEIIRR